jgi:hypothetical protein
MKTFLIDEELRDKLAFVTENGIFDYCQRLRDLPETKPDAIPIPTVDDIADHIDLWFRTGEDKPWNFLVEDLAGSIHSLLTSRLKGATP